MTLVLAGGRACTVTGAPCTEGGKPLSETLTVTVPGPATLSVADARAEEAGGTMAFEVSLDREATQTVTVDYETSDGTAAAGEDYEAASGTLTFAAGEQLKTVEVVLLDDAKDEGEETFALVLSNATGARIGDGEATGTIENDDPLQQAWIARFGRTVASQALDAVAERFRGGATKVTLGGQALASGEAPNADALAQAEADARVEAMARWLAGEEEETAPGRALSGREFLLGSSFSLNAGGEAGARRFGAWGRFATGGFDADVDDASLSGKVTTAFLGADVESGRWLGGVALGLSEGEGPFRFTGDADSELRKGTVESTLSALYPYARLAAGERLELWALGGVGRGTLSVDEEGGTPLKTDLAMTMGAVGIDGTVLDPPPEGGLALNIRSDALLVRMESDAVSRDAEDGGKFEGAQANVTRIRLIVEGARAFALEGDGALTPAFEFGLRQDGGDAETGTGVEAGAKLSYTRPGVRVEGAVRALVAHEESGYEEWGASAAVRIDPGASGRGLSFTLAPVWGNAGSGTDRLWGLADARGLAPETDFEARRRVDAAVRDRDFVRLDAASLACSPSVCVDRAILERTCDALMVPLDAGWADVGSWAAVSELFAADEAGNVAHGDVILEHTRDTLVHSGDRLVAVVGMAQCVIVDTADALLVAGRHAVQDVRRVVAELDRAGRSESRAHRRVRRPWGAFDTVHAGDGFKVKHLMVDPGQRLSLQLHRYRAEHWIVVRGIARVTCGDAVFTVGENESAFIPLGVRHRLENPGTAPLEIIEVQTGSRLDEDDIVRFEDAYGRAHSSLIGHADARPDPDRRNGA